MGIRTSERWRESLYRLSDGVTDSPSGRLNGFFETRAVLKLKASRSFDRPTLKQTKGQKAGEGS